MIIITIWFFIIVISLPHRPYFIFNYALFFFPPTRHSLQKKLFTDFISSSTLRVTRVSSEKKYVHNFFFLTRLNMLQHFFCRHSTCCNIFFSSQSTCCNMLQLFFQTLHITSNFFSHRHILTQPCWVKMQSDCMFVKTCRYDFESFWRTQRVS